MSFDVTAYEEMEITNIDSDVREIVKSARIYIEQLYEQDGIEDISAMRVDLIVDGKSGYFTAEDESEVSVQELLASMQNAEKITLEAYFSIERGAAHRYGYSYWSNLLNERLSALTRSVSYKCLEYYSSGSACAYEFDKDYIGDVEYDSTRDDVSDIDSWYCANFCLTATLDREFDNYESLLIVSAIEGLVDKYDLFKGVDAPKGNKLIFSNSLSIGNSLEELCKDLQDIVNELSMLGADVELVADFIPDAVKAFAAARLCIEWGEVSVQYCKY